MTRTVTTTKTEIVTSTVPATITLTSTQSITTPTVTTQPATTTATFPAITPKTTTAKPSPITTSISTSTSGAPPGDPFTAAWDDLNVYKQNLIDSEEAALDNLPGVSVYRIDIQIASNYLSLTGHEDIRYTNRETVGLNDIYFQLFPSMTGGKTTVSAVTVDGQPAGYSYENGGGSLRVNLPHPLAVSGSVILGIDFKVDVPASVRDNYGLFGYTNNVLALNSFYPAITAYDEKGWHAGPYPPQSDNTYQDAAFYLVRVTAPAKLVIAASGTAVENSVSEGRQVKTFAAGPARDFYLAGSEQYSSQTATTGGVNIRCYYLPGMASGAATALNVAKAAITSFSSRIGEYPYTELDIVPLDLQAGAAGIEYPGIIGVDIDAYTRPTSLEPSVAHEIGHQWFYNVVGDDQINEPWLDEAMTQYITGLYYLDAYGEAGWQAQRRDWTNRWSRVQFAAIPIGLPAASYQGVQYSAIIYGRGPLFIDALAVKMGADTFSLFLKEYYRDNEWQIVTTSIFMDEAEAACSCDLDALFKEWVLP